MSTLQHNYKITYKTPELKLKEPNRCSILQYTMYKVIYMIVYNL